ncbi:MAG: nitroreductase family protein [Bacillota bacterium]|nr:nitroreductase family protein [Bacillota bacterium]
MDVFQAMRSRHSVRHYTPQKINENQKAALQAEIAACNQEGNLHIQLFTEEPEAFGSILAHYGLFRGVRNYIALIGKAQTGLEECLGYYGERIVLKAQMLGLNTCWVAATFSRRKCKAEIAADERLVCVIALGYGADQGRPHRNKPLEALCRYEGEMPPWFRKGMEAVLLAPTAVNQQKFCFHLRGAQVLAAAASGPYALVDLGIVRYHFELAAGPENFSWVNPLPRL